MNVTIRIVIGLFFEELVCGHVSTSTASRHILLREHIAQVALLHLRGRRIATRRLRGLRHLLMLTG